MCNARAKGPRDSMGMLHASRSSPLRRILKLRPPIRVRIPVCTFRENWRLWSSPSRGVGQSAPQPRCRRPLFRWTLPESAAPASHRRTRAVPEPGRYLQHPVRLLQSERQADAGYSGRSEQQGRARRSRPGPADVYFETGRQWGIFVVKVPKDFGTKKRYLDHRRERRKAVHPRDVEQELSDHAVQGAWHGQSSRPSSPFRKAVQK